MPAPPVSSEEPELAPGETLPSASPIDSSASYTAAPTPSLESQPLVPERIASENTRTFMYRLPSGALASSDGAYIGGVPGPEHPGGVRQTDAGPGFQGPIASDPGYLPSWLKLHLSNGFHKDKVESKRYSLASGGGRRDVKETWDLKGYEVKGGASFTNRSSFLDGLHVQAEGGYAWAQSGDMEELVTVTTPAPAAGNPDLVATSESQYNDKDSASSQWSAAVGYEFSPDFVIKRKAHTSVIPLIGYGFAKQEFGVNNALAGIDYDLEWKGPFVGLDVGIEWPEYSFGMKTAYHWATYDGGGMSQDFDFPINNYRYVEDADAQGFTIGGNFRANVYYGLEIFADVALNMWSTDDSVTRLTSATGATSSVQMDEVTWRSQSYQLGIAYRW